MLCFFFGGRPAQELYEMLRSVCLCNTLNLLILHLSLVAYGFLSQIWSEGSSSTIHTTDKSCLILLLRIEIWNHQVCKSINVDRVWFLRFLIHLLKCFFVRGEGRFGWWPNLRHISVHPQDIAKTVNKTWFWSY